VGGKRCESQEQSRRHTLHSWSPVPERRGRGSWEKDGYGAAPPRRFTSGR
jgi:hypothetical protein